MLLWCYILNFSQKHFFYIYFTIYCNKWNTLMIGTVGSTLKMLSGLSSILSQARVCSTETPHWVHKTAQSKTLIPFHLQAMLGLWTIKVEAGWWRQSFASSSGGCGSSGVTGIGEEGVVFKRTSLFWEWAVNGVWLNKPWFKERPSKFWCMTPVSSVS